MNAPPILCPNCGSAVNDTGFCSNCGFAMYARPYPYRRRSGCLGGLIFAAGILLFVVGLAYALLVALAAACSGFPNGPQRDVPTPVGAILLVICGAAAVVAAIVIWIRTGAKNRIRP